MTGHRLITLVIAVVVTVVVVIVVVAAAAAEVAVFSFALQVSPRGVRHGHPRVHCALIGCYWCFIDTRVLFCFPLIFN